MSLCPPFRGVGATSSCRARSSPRRSCLRPQDPPRQAVDYHPSARSRRSATAGVSIESGRSRTSSRGSVHFAERGLWSFAGVRFSPRCATPMSPTRSSAALREFVERVVAAAMRVAGRASMSFELAERGAPGRAGAARGHDTDHTTPVTPRLRDPLDRREDPTRRRVHVEVLDDLVGDAGLEEPDQCTNMPGVSASGIVEMSTRTAMRCCRCGGVRAHERSTHPLDGVGHAWSVAEDGDHASEVVGRAARVVRAEEPPHAVLAARG